MSKNTRVMLSMPAWRHRQVKSVGTQKRIVFSTNFPEPVEKIYHMKSKVDFSISGVNPSTEDEKPYRSRITS